jgi:hypothetical protein
MLKCTCHCCTENHITDESKGVFDNISNAWNALFISWTWHNEINWLWKVWFPFLHIRTRWAVILLCKIRH